MAMTRRVALALALLFTTVAEAAAQAGWGALPDQLSTPQSTGSAILAPKVGVDGAGNAVALWTEPGPTPFGAGPTVRTSRFDVVTRRWSAPETLSSGRSSTAIDVAVDAAGNALAVWSANSISVIITLNVARYDAASGLWSPVSVATATLLNAAAVAMSPDGDAVVCWADASAGVACRRYAATTATWAPPENLGGSAVGLDVALDAVGNIHLVWPVDVSTVRTARFDAATATWGAAADLATALPGPGAPAPQVAMNDAGDAVATWSRGSVVEAARYPAGAAGWTAPATLSSDGLYNEGARPVVDASGIATVAWTHTSGTSRTIQVSRFDPMTVSWSAAANLPGQGGSAYGPAGIDADTLGNVHVVWSQSLVSPGTRLLASRFAVSTGQWTTVTNLSAISQSAFNSDVAVAPDGSAMAVWFQQSGDASVPQALRWDAAPAAPTTTAVTSAASTLSIAFTFAAGGDPALAPTALEYSTDGGASWVAAFALTTPVTVTGLIDGVTYDARLRLRNSAGPGPATTALFVRSGTDTRPGNLRVVSRTGNLVAFAWTPPPAGVVPDRYVLEGGLSGQSQVLATVPTGGPATTVTLSVPTGAFFVRVAAFAGAVRLGVSEPLDIAVNTSAVPASPTHLLGSASGAQLALSWTNQFAGATPTSLVLNVTGALTTSLRLPVTESFIYAGVPPGTYTFTVSAMNGPLLGASGSAVTLTFPGTCSGAPLPPTAFSATTQGGRIFLDWLPPTSGAAVTHYVVGATGAFTGSFPLTARTFSAPVPAGVYTVQVASAGPCGTSVPTAAQTVHVP